MSNSESIDRLSHITAAVVFVIAGAGCLLAAVSPAKEADLQVVHLEKQTSEIEALPLFPGID